MSASTPAFTARRSGGVRHPPEADIESIRDLLRGYGSSRSILKELIQNAEDAGATRMDVLHLPGNPASPHPLLRGPGLLVANDGGFTQDHRDAITQINLGTKALRSPTGMSNITNEPAFRDRLGGDLRLRPDSPCIDTGDDSVVQAGWLDLDGQPHILGNHVDMGAYEFSGAFVVDGLNPPGFRADGVFGFEFFALPGVRYVIEYRTTLSATGAVWQVLTNLTGSGGNAPVLDPGAAGPQRFYRAHTE